MTFTKKLSMAGAACLFSASAAALQAFDPSQYEKEVIAKIESLTILRLKDPTLPEKENVNVNVVNVFCPHTDMAKDLAPPGGLALIDHGSAQDLKDALAEYSDLAKALEVENDGKTGFVMAYIDANGKLHPAFTFNQAAKIAEYFQTDESLKGTDPKGPDLHRQINRLYTNLCFGNS
jgi:hypothetical protein